MPRKGPAPRRELMPDPIYRSVVVTQLVNKVLLRGQRSTSEHIVYKALDEISRKTGGDPVTVLKRAVENVRPSSRSRAGASAAPPTRCRSRSAPGGRPPWRSAGSSGYSRQRREKTMAERLSAELLDASNGIGAAIKRKEDLQKMAESNKAFAHYRW